VILMREYIPSPPRPLVPLVSPRHPPRSERVANGTRLSCVSLVEGRLLGKRWQDMWAAYPSCHWATEQRKRYALAFIYIEYVLKGHMVVVLECDLAKHDI
jgi:hypothetical protein